MQIDFPRSCARCALVMGAALFALLPCLAAHAEIPPSEASPADTERVFVSGVQDSFEQVRAAIDKHHVSPLTSVQGAREIAFFPPMTGG